MDIVYNNIAYRSILSKETGANTRDEMTSVQNLNATLPPCLISMPLLYLWKLRTSRAGTETPTPWLESNIEGCVAEIVAMAAFSMSTSFRMWPTLLIGLREPWKTRDRSSASSVMFSVNNNKVYWMATQYWNKVLFVFFNSFQESWNKTWTTHFPIGNFIRFIIWLMGVLSAPVFDVWCWATEP